MSRPDGLVSVKPRGPALAGSGPPCCSTLQSLIRMAVLEAANHDPKNPYTARAAEIMREHPGTMFLIKPFPHKDLLWVAEITEGGGIKFNHTARADDISNDMVTEDSDGTGASATTRTGD